MNSLYRQLKRKYQQEKTEREFLREIQALNKQQRPIKLVIGSSGTNFEGWVSSEVHFLNLLNEADWNRFFRPGTLSHVMAEHVWEHLTLEQGKQAIQNCYTYLMPGGRLRIAVPDGNHPSDDYIQYIKPGGYAEELDPGHDHKMMYNYKILGTLMEECGFEAEFLEYFDDEKKFHAKDWKKEDGLINRSIRYDNRNADGNPNYTSLIVDGIKKAK